MRSTFPKMSEAAVLQAYRVVLVIETTFIFIGNAFTIFVFWNQRHYLKRASSLLINLAVADFLVGARELIDTLTNYNDRLMFAQGDVPLIISAILFSSVSVFSLLVISFKRACAVIWPFRHRVARSGIYVTSILMVWLAGLCVATVNGLAVYGIVRYLTSFSFTSCALFVCLCLVLATYMTIRTRLRSTPPVCAAETQNRKLVEHKIVQNCVYCYRIVVRPLVASYNSVHHLGNLPRLSRGDFTCTRRVHSNGFTFCELPR